MTVWLTLRCILKFSALALLATPALAQTVEGEPRCSTRAAVLIAPDARPPDHAALVALRLAFPHLVKPPPRPDVPPLDWPFVAGPYLPGPSLDELPAYDIDL